MTKYCYLIHATYKWDNMTLIDMAFTNEKDARKYQNDKECKAISYTIERVELKGGKE